jgi:hypothetical protein
METTLLIKQDLDTYTSSQINIMAKHAKIPKNASANDKRWLLALHLRPQIAQMGTEYKVWLKNEYRGGDICNYIDWFIDILGTMDLLEELAETSDVVDLSRSTIREETDPKRAKRLRDLRYYFESNPSKMPDGIYFKDSHWYAVKDGRKTDAYEIGYQLCGTAHFCQTFATMIYKDETGDLYPGEYAHNIKSAINFIETAFKKHPELLYRFLNEVHTSEHATEMVALPGKREFPLSQLNKKDLLLYMEVVSANASSFAGCKEG